MNRHEPGPAEQAGPEPSARVPHPGPSLAEAAAAATCVLFDFDGPICRLFAGHPAPGVAERLKELVAAFHTGPLPAALTRDPHEVLRAVCAPGSGVQPILLSKVETLLATEEIRAAGSAAATPHAAELVHELAARRVGLAVTTNNTAPAAAEYLRNHGLAGRFGRHVYGREPERAHLMKPDPHCLLRAMEALGRPPQACLMVGDSPSDVRAAAAAGVPFVGYARNDRKAGVLRAAGAGLIVRSLGELREAFAAAG